MVNFEIALDGNGRLTNWTPPQTRKYGLYVFRADEEIIRVGESSSGCLRIAKGFKEPLRHIRRGKERKNYLAYSWREKRAGQSVAIDYFNLQDEPFADNYLRRSLEAELTFQLRLHMGHWPREMSEIHFLEGSRRNPDVIAQATRVLSRYGYSYRWDI